MKRWIALILALVILLAMAGCGCKHPAADLRLTDVDTEALTAKWQATCTDCGEVLEYREAATGAAPSEGAILLSAADWQSCLLTNIAQLGAGQTLYTYPVESEDDALLHAIVSMSQMFAVFSYRDADGNVITSQQSGDPGLVHNIYVEAQFTNDNAQEFFMLLMILLINNNSQLAPEDANTLASRIMSGEAATDNGYSYQMEILSAEDHTVAVSITAEG